ncbi:MAG: hypothetical protein DI536_08635 [Archangium gephyra]|uniref:Uncharacterized protein n=1 Tax=Archangium gephyra TaxID=48 RepID=A0A2W5TVW1_9BACT|nr:MAG: hypothetical protein DI536_08635 [Archangium gephyra]
MARQARVVTSLETGAAPSEGSNGSSQADNSLANAGAVYVFALQSGTWSQEAWLKASNAGAHDQFGISLAISANGGTRAVGAPYRCGTRSPP